MLIQAEESDVDSSFDIFDFLMLLSYISERHFPGTQAEWRLVPMATMASSVIPSERVFKRLDSNFYT